MAQHQGLAVAEPQSPSTSSAAQSRVRSPADDDWRCCLCGSNRFSPVYEWEVGHRRNPAVIPLGVWECECGLAFLHPVPKEDQLPSQGEWWSSGRPDIRRRRGFKRFREAFQRALFGNPKERFVKYTRKAKDGGRLLDVGCGTGALMNLMAPYYECEGLEPSPVGAEEARRKGFTIIEATLEEAEIPPQRYDVATLQSVIEHLHDPVGMLKKLNRMLKPSGVVALKTPKYRGMSCRRHGREWNGFRLGYHTFLFTGAVLGRALEAAGFEVLESPRRDRPLDDILILWGRKVRAVSSAP